MVTCGTNYCIGTSEPELLEMSANINPGLLMMSATSIIDESSLYFTTFPSKPREIKQIKCKNCGAPARYESLYRRYRCEYCDSIYCEY